MKLKIKNSNEEEEHPVTLSLENNYGIIALCAEKNGLKNNLLEINPNGTFRRSTHVHSEFGFKFDIDRRVKLEEN